MLPVLWTLQTPIVPALNIKMAPFGKLRPKGSVGNHETSVLPTGIKVWVDPDEAADIDIDIIFVHGLTGDRERT